MSRLDRPSLLKFLSKPRFVHEVAEHYGISKKLANFHLRKAIKSGHVLISEKPIFQTLRDSKGKLKRVGGFVYVFRNSPILVEDQARFAVREANDLISKSKRDFFSIGFSSKTHGSLGKGVFSHKLSDFTFEEPASSNTTAHRFRTSGHLTSEFDASPGNVKLVKQKTVDQLLRHRATSTQEVKSLSHVERINLFRALLKEPLTYLDLHGRFGVSKQIIRGLVKNRFLMEMWGPKAIGVRFKLTNKGKVYLRELEAAAKYEPKMKETALIRLKHRTSL